MDTSAVFATAERRAGMYESVYLRAFSPAEPVGVWIRYTVHKRPQAAPRGSLWLTVFDARRERPFQQKLTSEDLRVPEHGWIAIENSLLGPDGAVGECGGASWDLRVQALAPELRHLRPEWLYRAPLPRTKLTSPAPLAAFDGQLRVPGAEPIVLDGWRGMVGHNWGSEHAERWIWLHGTAFAGDERAWLDVGIGRVRLGGRMTPWVANGSLCVDGRRHRLGGALARGLEIAERSSGCELRLPGPGGVTLRGVVSAPAAITAGWRYADPDGGEHDVVNCSLASLELTAELPGGVTRTLSSAHGGAYELGMRERDHGIPLAPFEDR
jgi:hypothetical protein